MRKVTSIGSMPGCLKTFLTAVLSGENESTDVYDCTYDEIIDKAKVEKLEPQVIIDRKDTGRSFLCAVGASVRTIYALDGPQLKPIFYFAELDEPRKKQFQYELKKARFKVAKQHADQLEANKRIKEAAQRGAEELRNGQTGLN